MFVKQAVLLTFLAVAGSAVALQAQPPDAPPPPDAAQADPGAPPDGAQPDINYFYSNLGSYGHWVQVASYGPVWLPFNVSAGWRPYTLGHWVMTDYGWTWVSDEPFGWAAYHYGRWVDDPNYGWGWVPGYDWGPAWVAWRNGGGYIGWAALPPQVGFQAGVGLNLGGINLDVVLTPNQYCFVPERSFLEPRVATYIAPPARNITLIRATTNQTSYRMVDRHVVNEGIAVRHVEQVTGKRVAVLKMASASGGRPAPAQVKGGQLTMFRPTITKRAGTPPPPPPSTRASAATIAQQHQQEAANLQKSQAAERANLQKIHASESASPTSSKPAPKANNAAPKANNAPAQLEQQHQTELKAQQDQHQAEQKQLAARHQAELSQAKPAPRAPAPKNAGDKAPPKEEKRPQPPPPIQ